MKRTAAALAHVLPNTPYTHTHSVDKQTWPLSVCLLSAPTLPQVSSAVVFAVFCPLSTSLQYWWGLEVRAAEDTVRGASYTERAFEWFVYLKRVGVGGYDVCVLMCDAHTLQYVWVHHTELQMK